MAFDLTGLKFGRLTGIRRCGGDPKHGDALWLCKCDCGKDKVARSYDLRKGKTSHCGCLLGKNLSAGSLKHGCKPKRLHEMWVNMKTRCYNENYELYHRYGGRGITVCQEWLHDFAAFRAWALTNGYSDDLGLDRTNNNDNYSPNNCRFATPTEQSNNRSTNRMVTVFGETDTLANTARRYQINYATFQSRINHGVKPEDAINRNYMKQKVAIYP